jgi:hypothetical protein
MPEKVEEPEDVPRRLRLDCGTDPACDGDLRLPGPIALPIVNPDWFEVIASPSVSEDVTTQDNSGDDAENLQVVIQPSTGLAMHHGSGEIWHYTDAAGLIGILEGNCLWATSMSSLNDSAELFYGLEVLDNLLEEVRESKNMHPQLKLYFASLRALVDTAVGQRGLYVASASLAQNSLAQWRAYGGERAHALVLDSSAQLAVLSGVRTSNRSDEIPPKWAQVLYDQDKQRGFLLSCLGYIATLIRCRHVASNDCEVCRTHAVVIAESLAYCKDPSFMEEREVRLVVQSPDDSAVKFRSSRFGVTPYLRLTGTTGGVDFSKTAPSKLPIRKIVVGPFETRHSSAAAIPHLLRANNYGDVAVDTSASTLR